MKRICALVSLVVVLRGVAVHADGGAENWAEIVLTEITAGRPMPALSVYYDELDLDTAYAIQRALVESALGTRKIGGYKAGFTTAAAREKYRLDEPVSGVLFADGRREDGADIALDDFKSLMLEVEIGYVLRSPITRSLHSVEDLKTYVREAVPAIEMPDLNYANPAGLNARDIVATNVAVSAYLVGRPMPLRDLSEVNSIEVALYRDEELIDQGKAFDAMGNQLEALLWLINDLVARGWPLRADDVLITGTLGKINPGVAGHYRADYGRGGSVNFSVRPPAAAAQAKPK